MEARHGQGVASWTRGGTINLAETQAMTWKIAVSKGKARKALIANTIGESGNMWRSKDTVARQAAGVSKSGTDI